MSNWNYNSIGNLALVILGALATYLTSIGDIKDASLVGLFALIIKGIMSEISTQTSTTTATTPSPTATAPTPATPTNYAKVRAYFTRHFWLF
jgi:hypothetical protein